MLTRNPLAPVVTGVLGSLLLVPSAHATDPLDGPALGESLRSLGGVSWGGSLRDGDHAGIDLSRPDAHGPIGVMGEHLHGAGQWMLSIRAMSMHMDGLRDGDERLSPKDVLSPPPAPNGKFPVVPTEMDMDMVMFGGMYAPSDDTTLMLMVPWIDNRMEHVNAAGVEFETRSRGLGDVRVTALHELWQQDGRQLILNAGLSLPTGSTNAKDETPLSGGKDVRLPYPMQLGSGSYDLVPGLTFTSQDEDISSGAQALLRLPLHENDRGYRLGRRADVSAWVAQAWSDAASGSLRLAWSRWQDISGMDDTLNPNIVPTADPERQGGSRVDLFLGLNLQATEGAWKGHRLAIEVGAPIYQRLDGPALEVDHSVTVGWQKAFSR